MEIIMKKCLQKRNKDPIKIIMENIWMVLGVVLFDSSGIALAEQESTAVVVAPVAPGWALEE